MSNKKRLIEQIKATMQQLPKAIPVIFQRGHLPIGSDPDKHAESAMTETQRAELREREAKTRRQAKPGKQAKNEPEPAPEAKEDEGWVYSHQTEYDQYGAPQTSSDDIYAEMRNRLAQDFARQMFGNQRRY
jgi:hypothetical protein